MQNINLIKIGSDSINESNLTKLLDDINKYEQETKEKFIIISSGAVKLGKNKVLEKGGKIESLSTSSLASIGQQYLMQMYDRLSGEKVVGQVLLDDYINTDYINTFIEKVRDKPILKKFANKILGLVSEQKDKHLAYTIGDLVRNQVLVIINHNDTTSNDELKNLSSKTDNDKNTVHITEVINNYSHEIGIRVHRVIFLTNTNGLLDENQNTVIGGIVNLDDNDLKEKYLNYVESKKSNDGTGGMESKIECSFEVLGKGAKESIISNSNSGLDCLEDDNFFSTKFVRKIESTFSKLSK